MLSGLTANAVTEVAKYLFTLWNRRQGLTSARGKSLEQLISEQVYDQAAATKLSRQIIEIANTTNDTIKKELRTEFIAVPDDVFIAAMNNVEASLLKSNLNTEFLIAQRLDPIALFSHLKEGLSPKDGQHQAQSQIEEMTLRAIAQKLCSVADGLPEFSHMLVKQILENDYILLNTSAKILQDLQALTLAEVERGFRFIDPEFLIKQQVLKQFGQITLLGFDERVPGVVIDLDTSYIELQFHSSNPSQFEPLDVDYQSQIEYFSSKTNRLFVTGHAGSGKTTLLAYLALQAATNNPKITNIFASASIPVFVRLRDFADRPLPTGKQIFQSMSSHLPDQLESSWVARIIRENRAIYLFDGLDELPDKRLRDFEKWLSDFISMSPNSFFIVTSRPLSDKPKFVSRLKFVQIVIKPFGRGQIDLYVEAWHNYVEGILTSDQERQRLKKAVRQLQLQLDKDIHLARLAETPLMCAMICILNYTGRLRSDTALVDLYEDAVKFLIHDRNIEKQIFDEAYDILSFKDKVFLFKHVAASMIRTDELETGVAKLSSFIGTLFETKLGAHKPGKEEIAKALVRRAGVIGVVGDAYFSFIHKTFQEFFAAKFVVFYDEDQFVVNRLSLSRWREHVIFLSFLLPAQRANQLISSILKRAGKPGENEIFLLPLIATCIQSNKAIEPEIFESVSTALRGLVPPKNRKLAQSIAGAGVSIVTHLKYNKKYSFGSNNLMLYTLMLTKERVAVPLIVEHLQHAKPSHAVSQDIASLLVDFEDELDRQKIAKSLVEYWPDTLVYKYGLKRAFILDKYFKLYCVKYFSEMANILIDVRYLQFFTSETYCSVSNLAPASCVFFGEGEFQGLFGTIQSVRSLMIAPKVELSDAFLLGLFPNCRCLALSFESFVKLEGIEDSKVDEFIFFGGFDDFDEESLDMIDRLCFCNRRIDMHCFDSDNIRVLLDQNSFLAQQNVFFHFLNSTAFQKILLERFVLPKQFDCFDISTPRQNL